MNIVLFQILFLFFCVQAAKESEKMMKEIRSEQQRLQRGKLY